jgi:hypothetical protein
MSSPRIACEAAAIPLPAGIGGPRCGKPATFQTVWGVYCDDHAEALRASMKNPRTIPNLVAGRVRTDDEIARLVRPIAS